MHRETALPKSLPSSEREIYEDLVDTLFATRGSFLAGVAAGLLGPVIAWFATGQKIYFGLIMLMVALAGYRMAVLTAYMHEPITVRRNDAQKWEMRYAVGGIAFMTAVGVSAALMFTRHHTHMLAFYGVILMTGCAGALAGRNSGRPWIVFGQTIGACAPLALICMFKYDFWYWGLTVVLIFGMISVKSTTEFLHGKLVAALRNGHEASRQRRRFSLALNSMTHGLCMGDAELSITVINRRVVEFFGIVAATTPIRLDALARSIGNSASMSPAETDVFIDRWRRHAAMPHANVFMHQIGDRYFDFHCERAEGGAFITVIEDVTAQRRALREIERMAHYDELTSLPNRYQFQDLLAEDLVQLRRRGFEAALLNIDLDRFKEVNDTLGHTIGDQLLATVGKRLADCVKAPNIVARLGGDEFCVLLRASEKHPDIESLADRILEELHRPFSIENHTINIGASIGVAMAPEHADTPVGLLKCSDLALYHSKANGRGKTIWYTQSMQDALTRKREIELELRNAISARQLVLFYQPIIDSRTGAVVCMEALMRWRHPQRGMVSPAEFIPVAEETGMIVELGAWALRQACRDAVNCPPHVRIAVNLAPRQFQASDLPQRVATVLRETGLPAHRLELEITESTLMMDNDNVEAKVREIEALGVRLSLDDFGTGFSSLGYLDRFPVKKVKIDRSFTLQALKSQKTQAIIGAISVLARDLEIELVAEGVETVEQLAFMTSKNIHLIQGYLYSPPRPIEEIMPRLAAEAIAPPARNVA